MTASSAISQPDLICLSHLRWDFVYQRPQHLLSRFARDRRVFFIEEPVFGSGPARMHTSERDCGAVVTIDPAALPQRANIHYLGGKDYKQLPAYLAGWDVGVMPFAHNDSTRFISPTKTPEYLAAGCPVVSTSIRDVVRPYDDLGLVSITDTIDEFTAAAESAMNEDVAERLRKVDAFLERTSWDMTWSEMNFLIESVTGRGDARANESKRLASA